MIVVADTSVVLNLCCVRQEPENEKDLNRLDGRRGFYQGEIIVK